MQVKLPRHKSTYMLKDLHVGNAFVFYGAINSAKPVVLMRTQIACATRRGAMKIDPVIKKADAVDHIPAVNLETGEIHFYSPEAGVVPVCLSEVRGDWA